jgi:2-polyprenyl-3-methyl-5-hydroxy-6-metoxy-1,4-benzoquinol methylase
MEPSHHPHLNNLAEAVLEAWPEHRKFLGVSFDGYDATELALLDDLASRIVRLAGGELDGYAASYHWTCRELNKETLYFKKNGAYRLSHFADAERLVYSNSAFMKRYMEGLLMSQALWRNHATAFLAFRTRYLARFKAPFRYLEIGPGHGLFLSVAAEHPLCGGAEGWDVSAESVRQTAHALAVLGCADKVALAQRDVMAADVGNGGGFDAIVISEVLEHIERPREALRALRPQLTPGGTMFINVPVNSPAPDHIYLLREAAEARALVESAGLQILDLQLAPMTGLSVAEAERQKATISCLMIAR